MFIICQCVAILWYAPSLIPSCYIVVIITYPCPRSWPCMSGEIHYRASWLPGASVTLEVSEVSFGDQRGHFNSTPRHVFVGQNGLWCFYWINFLCILDFSSVEFFSEVLPNVMTELYLCSVCEIQVGGSTNWWKIEIIVLNKNKTKVW